MLISKSDKQDLDAQMTHRWRALKFIRLTFQLLYLDFFILYGLTCLLSRKRTSGQIVSLLAVPGRITAKIKEY